MTIKVHGDDGDSEFNAAVDWLVSAGRVKSKGEARRKLTEQNLAGIAKALDDLAPGAGSAAQVGIDLANRSIAYLAQEAGKANDASTEVWHRDGIPWHEAPIPQRWHRCKVQTEVWLNYGLDIERCACGATRGQRSGTWMHRNERRRGH